MRKLHIAIPQPCHEKWSEMTAEEQGRFCGSCQKNVIDFSQMNDRQVADFFKKPAGSICGRFRNDQLDRPILVPPKRIPWIRYFFQFTWPAFLFFLKSCTEKERTTGELKWHQSLNTPLETPMVVGALEIRPMDPILTTCDFNEMFTTTGITISNWDTLEIPREDSEGVQIDTSAIEEQLDSLPITDSSFAPRMDTLEKPATVNEATDSIDKIESTVSIEFIDFPTRDTKSTPAEIVKQISNIREGLAVYPNPVKAGSMLTIDLDREGDFPELVKIVSVSGQVISSFRQTGDEYATVINVQIPPLATPGVYFIHLVTRKKLLRVASVMISN